MCDDKSPRYAMNYVCGHSSVFRSESLLLSRCYCSLFLPLSDFLAIKLLLYASVRLFSLRYIDHDRLWKTALFRPVFCYNIKHLWTWLLLRVKLANFSWMMLMHSWARQIYYTKLGFYSCLPTCVGMLRCVQLFHFSCPICTWRWIDLFEAPFAQKAFTITFVANYTTCALLQFK